MNSHRTSVATFQQHPFLSFLSAVSGVIFLSLTGTLTAHAANPQIPWECSNYNGEAQTRCLNSFIELQREKIGQLEGQLQAQQSALGQFKDLADRQAAATADLQRQLSDRPSTAVLPVPYPSAYYYPPGFGLYLGRPWVYGSPYYYRGYWNQGFHRHGGHRR